LSQTKNARRRKGKERGRDCRPLDNGLTNTEKIMVSEAAQGLEKGYVIKGRVAEEKKKEPGGKEEKKIAEAIDIATNSLSWHQKRSP